MSTWVNYDDVIDQLAGARLDLGHDSHKRPLTFDGQIQRWLVSGEDREYRGWTRLREWTSAAGNTYIVGAYGVWSGTDDGYTKIEMPRRDNDGARPALSEADVMALREAQKAAAKATAERRKAEAKQAARWAAQVWAHATPATEHEYLTRKRIGAHGARIMGEVGELRLPGIDESNLYRLQQADGALVVPMHDEHANVCGIQFIYPKGHARARKIERDKEFWPSGMAMGGTFGLIGPLRRSGVLLVAEGFATAASLHEASGHSVAYAFSANNLAKAGKLIRKTCKAVRLLFCADDDYQTDGNPGVTHAAAACAEIEQSAWVKPDFFDEAGNDLRDGRKLTDFNDLFILTGLPLVLARQINDTLDGLEWREAGGGGRGNQNGGAGGSGEGGQDGRGRRRAQAVMPVDDLVARYVPLDDGTGKYVFDTWTNKIATREQMIALLPAGQRADDIKRHPVWIERGAYYLDEVGFDPSGADPAVRLNTWRGWPLTAKAGKCERLLELLEYFCGGEENARDVYRWVLRWMAYPLQFPGAKMQSAVILHGPQGTGKSTVFQALAKIYGDYSVVLNQRGLEDKFNSDWSDSKLFILAEEVVTRAEMWHIKNELKELVTGEWVRVNPKGIAAYRQRNQINIVFSSNEHQPLPIENDDRRHCVIWTPPPVGREFYAEVREEIATGGIEAFYHHLLNLDLGDFKPWTAPPMTDAKKRLILLSLPSEHRFINDWAEGDTEWPLVPCLASDLYAAYLRWCRINGEQRPRPSNQFHGFVARMPGWSKKKCRVHADLGFYGQAVGRPMILPPDDLLSQAGKARQDGQSIAHWLTEGYIEFQQALNKREDRWAA